MSASLPEVFLLVSPKDLTLVVDEVCNIDQLVISGLFVLMSLHDRAGDDADVVLLGQGPVSVEIYLPLPTKVAEFGIVRHPVGQMVLREHCQMGSLTRSILDELNGLGIVALNLHGLMLGQWKELWQQTSMVQVHTFG